MHRTEFQSENIRSLFFLLGTSISYVKVVTVLYDQNCDRKFQFSYCIVTNRKTVRAIEVVFWVSFVFLLQGTHLPNVVETVMPSKTSVFLVSY